MNHIVTEDANWMTMDIKDFYLGTPLPRTEYMRIDLKQIPPKSREKYISDDLVRNEQVLAEIRKGIYGLTQAGLLAQERLVEHLAKHEYHRLSEDHPCIFKHKSRKITFCLVVDDFGVMYHEREDAEHLLCALEELYSVKADWEGTTYVGFHVKHDKGNRVLTLSMPNYISEAAKRFNIKAPVEVVSYPYLQGDEEDQGECTSHEKKRIQQIVGVIQYYARALDLTLLTAVTKLASQQARATRATLRAAERLIEYAMTQPSPEIHFHPSDMQLLCFSDASYLTESESRSRYGGYFFLGSDKRHEQLNGPILCISSIVDVVTSSAAESEYAAAYNNAKEATYIRSTLEALGYTQEPTPIITDNSFVDAATNGNCKQKRAKAMDMRFNWLRDRVKQKQFKVTWCQGIHNVADYFTKVLPCEHFKKMRDFVLPMKFNRVIATNLPSTKKTQVE
jgi:hypothetical protein